MPSIGNQIPVMTGAANYPLPDRYMSALRAGLRFFILRYPKFVYTDQRVMGPFDVRCTEEAVPGIENAAYDMRWLTGVSAGITFYILQEGLAVAHMVDDIYFHNRILLLTHPWLLTATEGVLTREGVLPAAQLGMEVRVLREVLCEPRKMYKVVRENGTEVTFRWTREEAEKIIATEEHRMMNKMPFKYKPFEKCTIVEGEKISYKPRFEKMIQMYSKQPYGWTACPEFKDEVIPLILNLSAQRISGMRPAAQPAFDMEAMMAQMRNQIMAEIQSGKLNPAFSSGSLVSAPAAEAPTEPAPAQQAAPAAPRPAAMPQQKYTKSKLHPLNKTELRAVAAEQGVAVNDTMTKEAMITAILSRQDEEAPVVR